MRSRRDEHARWRELGAAALEGQISAGHAAQLDTHLRSCPACRAAVRDYTDQRHALRALPGHVPPRDLAARTSAALDREIARGSRGKGGSFGRPRPGLVGGAFVASVTVLGLSLALVGTQSIPIESPRVPTGTAAGALRPTPFTIPSEALAFVGSGIDGLSVYRTRVDRVCPQTFIDCVDYPSDAPSVVALPRDLRPSNVALSPNGASLAIQARERDGGQTIAVVAIPADDLIDPIGPGSAPAPTLVPAASSTPEAAPSATPVLASVSGLPLRSEAPETSPAVVPPSPAGGSELPLATADLDAGDDVIAILEDVIGVGAPPAWSADGTALAFSAMPADRSHGPDIYIWRPSDARATPLTTDHASYFASWSGSRIVGSRVSAAAAGDGATPAIDIIAIDTETGEHRVVTGVGLWLPNVSPLGTHAVGWQGTLDVTTNEALPVDGELYIADWRTLDPFAVGSVPETSPAAQPSAPVGSPVPGQSPAPAAGASGGLPGDSTDAGERDRGGETPQPTGSTAPQTAKPGATPAIEASPTPRATEEAADAATETGDQGDATSDPSTTPDSNGPAPAVDLVPVEPDRAAETGPVQDWHVRWSVDGTVLGYWIADVPGASWGRLAVVTVDAESGDLAHDEPLLAPSLARRAFTLGLSRVAWVAPSDAEPDGELRIRTWGPDGSGGLRLRPLQPGEVIPVS